MNRMPTIICQQAVYWKNAWQYIAPALVVVLSIAVNHSSGTGISNRSRQLYPRFIPCKSPKEFVEGTTGHYVEAWAAVFK